MDFSNNASASNEVNYGNGDKNDQCINSIEGNRNSNNVQFPSGNPHNMVNIMNAQEATMMGKSTSNNFDGRMEQMLEYQGNIRPDQMTNNLLPSSESGIGTSFDHPQQSQLVNSNYFYNFGNNSDLLNSSKSGDSQTASDSALYNGNSGNYMNSHASTLQEGTNQMPNNPGSIVGKQMTNFTVRTLQNSLLKTKNRRNKRTVYTYDQKAFLERILASNCYPNKSLRLQISQKIGIEEPRIKIWFKNRRAKMNKVDDNASESNLSLSPERDDMPHSYSGWFASADRLKNDRHGGQIYEENKNKFNGQIYNLHRNPQFDFQIQTGARKFKDSIPVIGNGQRPDNLKTFKTPAIDQSDRLIDVPAALASLAKLSAMNSASAFRANKSSNNKINIPNIVGQNIMNKQLHYSAEPCSTSGNTNLRNNSFTPGTPSVPSCNQEFDFSSFVNLDNDLLSPFVNAPSDNQSITNNNNNNNNNTVYRMCDNSNYPTTYQNPAQYNSPNQTSLSQTEQINQTVRYEPTTEPRIAHAPNETVHIDNVASGDLLDVKQIPASKFCTDKGLFQKIRSLNQGAFDNFSDELLESFVLSNYDHYTSNEQVVENDPRYSQKYQNYSEKIASNSDLFTKSNQIGNYNNMHSIDDREERNMGMQFDMEKNDLMV